MIHLQMKCSSVIKVSYDLFYSQRKGRVLNAPFVYTDEDAPRARGYRYCNRSYFHNNYLTVSLSLSWRGVFQLEGSCQYFLILSGQLFGN